MLLFPPWDLTGWRRVDDSVRGGSSVSYLDPLDDHISKEDDSNRPITDGVCFHGFLDIDTLGGAGFASQRYAFDPPLDLDYARFSGIRIEVVPCSEGGAREFTMTIATTPSEYTPDGKPASRVSWEASFSISSGNAKDVGLVELPFDAFVPTYRGRKVEGKPEFATRTTYEVGIMCRSGFGKQKGKFGVGIRRVEVVERGWGGRIARLVVRVVYRFFYMFI